MDLATDLAGVTEALESRGIPYMIVGALAVEAYTFPRTTFDLDVQVAMEPPSPSASTFLGFIVEERSHDPVFDQVTLVSHVATSPRPIEFFFTRHWFTMQALGRRRLQKSERLGRDLPMPTPEDLLLLKLAFYAAPTRARRKAVTDALDVENLLVAEGERMDRAYVRANAERLGLSRRLAEFDLS